MQLKVGGMTGDMAKRVVVGEGDGAKNKHRQGTNLDFSDVPSPFLAPLCASCMRTLR